MNTIAEIELSYSPTTIDNSRLTHSSEVYRFCKQIWNMNTISLQEEMKLILLNRNNTVLGVCSLSKGGITATIVDIRLIMAVALKSAASAIILVHNHPSGNLKPSGVDRKLTDKVKQSAELMDIRLLDHLIITQAGYTSFTDEGLI